MGIYPLNFSAAEYIKRLNLPSLTSHRQLLLTRRIATMSAYTTVNFAALSSAKPRWCYLLSNRWLPFEPEHQKVIEAAHAADEQVELTDTRLPGGPVYVYPRKGYLMFRGLRLEVEQRSRVTELESRLLGPKL